MDAPSRLQKRKASSDSDGGVDTDHHLRSRNDASFSTTTTQRGSDLLDLSTELRLLILGFVFEEAPRLKCSIYDPSTSLQPNPAVTLVCRQLRMEALPLYYAGRAFFFNVTRQGELARLQRWTEHLDQAGRSRLRYIRKWTIFGRSHGGQISVTIDFSTLKIVDARWRPSEELQAARVRLGQERGELYVAHYHVNIARLRLLQDALVRPDYSFRGSELPRTFQAMSTLLHVCRGFFEISPFDLMQTTVGHDSFQWTSCKRCECEEMRAPVT